jgi:glycerate dehydrogenase
MDGVSFTDMETLFRQADVVSLHCPLNDDNQRFLNKQLLALMKPSSYIINVSRGGLVNEDDLAYALNHDIIAGAGLDVLSVEPPRADNPLLKAKNCIITPHQAWAAQASRSRLLNIAVSNLIAFLNGHPRNVVS